MVKVTVTGGIACGKSLVGSFLEKRGVAVCDADDLAHNVIKIGKPAFEKVVKRFGAGILNEDGEVDRARLGATVFSNPGDLEYLNSIIHPEVKKAWQAWLEEKQAGLCKTAAVIIPLLFEIGVQAEWDIIITVFASLEKQIQRLKVRGFSSEEARRRIEAQMPVLQKSLQSDYVVINDYSMELTELQTEMILESIMEK